MRNADVNASGSEASGGKDEHNRLTDVTPAFSSSFGKQNTMSWKKVADLAAQERAKALDDLPKSGCCHRFWQPVLSSIPLGRIEMPLYPLRADNKTPSRSVGSTKSTILGLLAVLIFLMSVVNKSMKFGQISDVRNMDQEFQAIKKMAQKYDKVTNYLKDHPKPKIV